VSPARAVRPDDDVAGAVAAHRRLLDTVKRLTDEDARRPSLLDGWTVGHVLTHLARNADSHARMLEAAAAGQVVPQYAGGLDQRAADIETGHGRDASVLADDVRQSCARLEHTWRTAPPEAWAGYGMNSAGGQWPCAVLPFHRWREVEVHHCDLGLGFSWADWPDSYVQRELPRALAALPERLIEPRARQHLTAWLLGRAEHPVRLEIAGWQDDISYYHR
jgi:maleylpyruvate isomerase